MRIWRKQEFWFALLLLVPTLIVAGLYKNTTPFSVTITAQDLDQCGGTVTPSGIRTVAPGEDLIIAITLGNCQSWECQIEDDERMLLYQVTDVQSRRIRIDRIAEDQNVTIVFHKTIPSDEHAQRSTF